jgi:hypothetical protein
MPVQVPVSARGPLERATYKGILAAFFFFIFSSSLREKIKRKRRKGTEKRHGTKDYPVSWLFPYFSLCRFQH